MIGLVLVTHGRLAEEMLSTLRTVLGSLEQIEAVSTGVEEDPDVVGMKIRRAVERADRGEGSLILTDMLGDTATNLSLAISRERQAEVVAGVNMPMLVKAVTCRQEMTLQALADFIQGYGRDHIFWVSRGGKPARSSHG